MIALMRRALARLPLSAKEVLAIYDLPWINGANHMLDLCESHERLRAELQGAEALLEENRRLILQLTERVAAQSELLARAAAKEQSCP
jgi:hypothetical protein